MLLLPFLVFAPSSSSAQRVSVATVRARSTHELLEGPRGTAVSLDVPIRGRVGAAVTVERLHSEKSGVGIVCGGLINPEACPAEPYDQEGHLRLTAVGADVPLIRISVAELSLRPQLLWARAKTFTRGHDTDNRLVEEKGQIGFSAAVELRVTPVRRLPLELVAGAATRRIGPLANSGTVDGYTPFDRWHGLRALYLGGALAWHHAERSSAP